MPLLGRALAAAAAFVCLYGLAAWIANVMHWNDGQA